VLGRVQALRCAPALRVTFSFGLLVAPLNQRSTCSTFSVLHDRLVDRASSLLARPRRVELAPHCGQRQRSGLEHPLSCDFD